MLAKLTLQTGGGNYYYLKIVKNPAFISLL